MNWYDVAHLLALANFGLCSAIGYVCACRFSVMSRDTRLIFRTNYALLFTAATASGFQPLLFREFPGMADLIGNAVLLFFLASGMRTWRGGAPDYTARDGQYVHMLGGRP